MKNITVTFEGKNYMPIEATDSCTGCAFEHDDVKCISMPKCYPYIYAEVPTPGSPIVPTEDTIDSTSTDTQDDTAAAHYYAGMEYYRNQLDAIGDLLGIAAYTCDDGSISDSPLRAKLPELVAKLVYDNVVLKSRLQSLGN